MTQHLCRFCSAPLARTFVDLGLSPLANANRSAGQLDQPETFYPLHTYLCETCLLVQLPAVQSPEEIFSEYDYFSSVAATWLAHAEAYAEAMTERFALDSDSLVIEVASNDGYLLRFFQARKIPVLGIEPAKNVADAAEKIGIPTLVEFFGEPLGRRLAEGGRRADLLVANNVLAHTPHLGDFVAGLAAVLAPDGVLTLEFPHLLELIEHNQFDTIYHEHFSYFSFSTAVEVLAAHGLAVFDVERLPTHGGSLRVYARHAGAAGEIGEIGERVAALLAEEETRGYRGVERYRGFAERVHATKRELLRFLIAAKEKGERIVGYGAPAKGNTLLNYCGIGTDFLDFTVDRSERKQGLFLPGSHVPIRHPDAIRAARPDYVLILPWNLKDEIVEQMSDVRSWGGRFVVAIPKIEVLA